MDGFLRVTGAAFWSVVVFLIVPWFVGSYASYLVSASVRGGVLEYADHGYWHYVAHFFVG